MMADINKDFTIPGWKKSSGTRYGVARTTWESPTGARIALYEAESASGRERLILQDASTGGFGNLTSLEVGFEGEMAEALAWATIELKKPLYSREWPKGSWEEAIGLFLTARLAARHKLRFQTKDWLFSQFEAAFRLAVGPKKSTEDYSDRELAFMLVKGIMGKGPWVDSNFVSDDLFPKLAEFFDEGIGHDNVKEKWQSFSDHLLSQSGFTGEAKSWKPLSPDELFVDEAYENFLGQKETGIVIPVPYAPKAVSPWKLALLDLPEYMNGIGEGQEDKWTWALYGVIAPLLDGKVSVKNLSRERWEELKYSFFGGAVYNPNVVMVPGEERHPHLEKWMEVLSILDV